ncbi:G-protein coupled receptor 143 [Patella vulgata]|uniref:G-protein coupled receptor 143 n=1 Tax=Patella vulgata TaxID=6465 RepID=UPI00217FCF11|nr:G-protein coupled receptor 143 [Patella vulgata]XP_050408828.1 G-protein coupled receptor 143 [Patella vulgata]
MSNPSYLSLCCANENSSRNKSLEEQGLSYSSVDISCLVAACVSVIGTVYLLMPRFDSDLSHTLSTSQTRILAGNNVRRVIHILIFCDILACIGLIVRSSLNLSDRSLSGCLILNVWIQYFFLCTYFWNIAYGVELLMSLKNTGNSWIKYVIGFILPLGLCSLQVVATYYSSFNWCLKSGYEKTLVYLSAYLPIGVVIIVNPIVFYHILKSVRHLLICQLGQFTGSERNILGAAKLKFTLIMLVFTICWIPNLIFALLQSFTVKDKDKQGMLDSYLAFAIFQAISNPLQGVCNCIVFRGWPGFLTSCTQRAIGYSRVEQLEESIEVRINSLSNNSFSPRSENDRILGFRHQRTRHYT